MRLCEFPGFARNDSLRSPRAAAEPTSAIQTEDLAQQPEPNVDVVLHVVDLEGAPRGGLSQEVSIGSGVDLAMKSRTQRGHANDALGTALCR